MAVVAGGLALSLAACQGSEQTDPSQDTEGTAVNTSQPDTSVKTQIDGWEPISRGSTDYRSIILAEELVDGDGKGSRLIIQEGIPSSQSAEEHRENLLLDMQTQGVSVNALPDREIDGEAASGLAYKSGGTSRAVQTWYVVKDRTRYTIHLESEEGADEVSAEATQVLDNIVLGG